MSNVDYALVREMAWRRQFEEERLVRLGEKDWREFLRQLDLPPIPNPELVNLLRSKAPWDKP